MYSPNQIFKGLSRPRRAVNWVWRRDVRPNLPHDISIRGNYWTGNVGNRAVGEILKYRLGLNDTSVKLFSDNVDSTRAPIRMIGGGGGFHDRWGPNRIRSRLDFVSDCQGAIVATGVPGVQTTEGRKIIEEKLPEIGVVTVRSQLDLEKLSPGRESTVYVTACPTLLYADPDEELNERTGVNFLPWFFKKDDRYETYFGDQQHLTEYFGYSPEMDVETAKREYIANAQRVCANLDSPVFIPFTKDDELFAKQYLDVEIQPYTFSVAETFKRVSRVNRMVSTRFHGLVFAAVCRKPTLALAYAPKVTSLADRLDIRSYKPHHDFPIEFEKISNLKMVRKSATENFDLLDKHVLKDYNLQFQPSSDIELTNPYFIDH